MAKINDGKGFENFDIKAYEIEQGILKREREEAKTETRGRPRKPRIDTCIYCGNKFAARTTHINMNNYEDLTELTSEFGDDELTACICNSCKRFWGINKMSTGNHYPGWNPQSAIDRLEEARALRYAMILKTQAFGTPSGNSISVEFGDIFPIKRVGVEGGNSKVDAIDFYSIDIMVGVENLRLFPWEFGTISWTEIMLELRDKQYEAVYLGNDDVAGYYEPVPEVREILTNAFGDR